MERHGSCIRGIGAYIPEKIRSRADWPDEVVANWRKRPNVLEQLSKDCAEAAEYIHPVLIGELSKLIADPFVGMQDRRVAPREMTPADMETSAAHEAIKNAGIRPEQITMVMDYCLPDNYYLLPNAPIVQHRLGIPAATAFGVQAYCFSLLKMLSIAHQFISSGAHEYVLCTSATKYSDIMDYSTSISVMSGDGAAAFVVGRCSPEEGVAAVFERSEGQFQGALRFLQRRPTMSAHGSYDYLQEVDDFRFYLTPVERTNAQMLIARVPYWAETACKPVLERAGWRPNQVDLFICNAASAWYTAVAAKMLGIDMKRTEDHVLEYANAGAAISGLNLYEAYRKGRLTRGSKLLMFGHGGGANFGAVALNWV